MKHQDYNNFLLGPHFFSISTNFLLTQAKRNSLFRHETTSLLFDDAIVVLKMISDLEGCAAQKDRGTKNGNENEMFSHACVGSCVVIFRPCHNLDPRALLFRAWLKATSFPGSLFSVSLSGWNRDPGLQLVTWPPRIWVVEKSAGRVGQQGFRLDQMYLSTHPPCGFGWIDGHVASRNQGLCSND